MATFPEMSLDKASRFLAALGLEFDEIRADAVTGRIELGPQHHNPWAVVHGGVYSTIVERAASVGASRAVHEKGLFAVGVHNMTDVFVAAVQGPAVVTAHPVFQGELQQVWSVDVSADEGGTLLARGQLRLQNIPARKSGNG
ncbi:PaaI family thioesterase [Streptomyces pinistramenti]|uniref:PaaI family thioesterase n=1 Tax=Streptomyces pinistramenti TaxID=2884812 RepID=UPI001D063E89|nr:PaaI family thioesterase [Streptomyces pinistramenti]MCB5910853.1 PaaI family thioesterase [Streptomyces pinistramenti]